MAAFARLLAGRGNDLSAAAIALCPEIALVLEMLAGCRGALLSRMSGSGATCFALFADATEAAAAAAGIRQQRPNWWTAAARVAGDDDNV